MTWAKAGRLLGLFWLSFLLFTLPLFAESSELKNIRANILNCATFLVMEQKPVNDSVGLPIATGDPADFKLQFSELVEEKGLDAFKGAKLFVTGINMRDKKVTKKEYEVILSDLGFEKGALKVRVLSIPEQNAKLFSKQVHKILWERFRYWFPSIERDYQKPMLQEIFASMAANSVNEIGNVVYLINALPSPDAYLVVAAHTGVLMAYDLFRKFMLNWLLRPGVSRKAQFVKQLTLSLPFVVNYNLFGNYSAIKDYWIDKGNWAVMEAVPAASLEFVTTQGLTVLLQTLFYQHVITNGIGAWENSHEDAEDAQDARVATSPIKVPFLTMDAIALAMAAGTSATLLEFGPMDLNMGHAALVGLTLLGLPLKKWPQIMNPALPAYRWLRRQKDRLFGVFQVRE